MKQPYTGKYQRILRETRTITGSFTKMQKIFDEMK